MEERIVHIERASDEERLGVDIDDSDGVTIVVKKLKPGLIEDWNRSGAGPDVRIGDVIVQVNDVRGSADAMFEQCMTANALVLRLRRPEVPEETACITDCPEVWVHAYTLWGSRYHWPRLLNAGSTRFGVFHTGVEVFGREWYFCGTENGFDHGVYCMPEPKKHPVHRYCRSVHMGASKLSRGDLEDLMPSIRDKWLGGTYNPWKRNCHSFTDFFCQILGFPSGPSFGLFSSGDRRLVRLGEPQGDPEADEARRCFPCRSRVRLWSRSIVPSPPLLVDETSGRRLELQPPMNVDLF